MAIDDGAPLEAAFDPDYNGSRPYPGGSWPDRKKTLSADRLREAAQRKGAPLTQVEIDAVMKRG